MTWRGILVVSASVALGCGGPGFSAGSAGARGDGTGGAPAVAPPAGGAGGAPFRAEASPGGVSAGGAIGGGGAASGGVVGNGGEPSSVSSGGARANGSGGQIGGAAAVAPDGGKPLGVFVGPDGQDWICDNGNDGVIFHCDCGWYAPGAGVAAHCGEPGHDCSMGRCPSLTDQCCWRTIDHCSCAGSYESGAQMCSHPEVTGCPT